MSSPSSDQALSEQSLGWLDGLDSAFEQAAANGIAEHSYSIAGRPLLVRFAGRAMADRFMPALEHLQSEESADDAHVVQVWDAASTGTAGPPVSVPADSPGGTVFTHADAGRRALYMVGLRSLNVYDAGANSSWYWTADAARLPAWECASPLRHLLHWWLAANGLQQVHAGAIGTDGGAVLVVGRGGRGKSTTTLAGLGAGLKYVGDDYVAVETKDRPLVHSIYNAGKLEPHHLERFPVLREHATIDPPGLDGDFEQPKAVVYVHAQFPEQTVSTLPLVGIVVPTIAAGRTALVPAARAEALRALAPSTLLQLHVGEQGLLTSLTALVARLPAYTLRLGDDLERVGPLIASVIDGSADG